MNSFLTKLLASVILIIMCLFSILPTVEAAMILNEIENNKEKTKEVEKEDNIIENIAEKNDSFQVMLASILNTSENLDTNDLTSRIPNEKGIWIKEDDREYIISIINQLTNKKYKINKNGFLIEDDENVKSEQDKKEIYNFYTKKIDELINKEKLIVISIDDKYKQLNDIDNDIIDIKVEEDDYALLFIENKNKENSNEIIILNDIKYNAENKENTIAFLMNKILEVYYHDDAEFKEFEQNCEFIDNSGIYENVVNKKDKSEVMNNEQNSTEEKIENVEDNQGSNSRLESKEIITDTDKEVEEITTETDEIIENDKFEIGSKIEESTTEEDENNDEIMIESNNNTQDIRNEAVENIGETTSGANTDISERHDIFDDSVTENDFNVIMSGILADNVNLENREIICDNQPNECGIWISEDARQQFLDFLNKHAIYTYTVDSNGYLICDNIMKDNANLDMGEKVETEVDIEIKNILTQNILIMIGLDDKYLGYDENQNITLIQFTNEDYIKSFSYNNQRIVILNKAYYENTTYNLALSDYFIKSLDNIQEKVLKGELTFNIQSLARSDTSKQGNMLSAQTVYAGPSSSNYATVGSVSSDEMVYLLGQSAGWYHIQYIVTSTGKQKSGFVPVSTVNNNGYSIHEEEMTGGQNFATETVNILSCDNFDLAVSLGSVFGGEGMTVLYTYGYSDSNKSYDVAYVEISTSSGTKRGYIYTSKLTGINYPSSVARATTSNSAYAGPDSSYVRLGGVSENEFVTILAKNTGNDWTWVEYNTTAGRKRGFMLYSNLSNYNHPGGYNDLPVNNGIRKATEDLDVNGAPGTGASSIGSISKEEIVSIYNTERGYAYIEYSTTNGAKRGYVPEECLIDATAPTIPNIIPYSFEEGTYGTSGKGQALKYYKLGNGTNVAFTIFEQHGWEDAWAYDGEELIKIAQRVMQDLSSTGISSNWTLYIIPYANPDGVTHGYTNNGPGRCTVTSAVDMNRCWPANFVPYYTSRNYTGAEPLGTIEAQSLKNFIENNIGNGEKIILDIHGWLDKTYGDSEIGNYFSNQFGFTHVARYGSGYLTTWGKAIGAKTCLVEYPMPTSSESIINNNYSGKTSLAIRNMLNSIGQSFVEEGEIVDEEVKVVVDGNLNVRQGPGTSYTKIETLSNGTIVKRIKRGVASSNGYMWDKIQLSDGRIGYVATDYLSLYVISAYNDGTYTYEIAADGMQPSNFIVDANAELNYRDQEQKAGKTEMSPIDRMNAGDTQRDAESLAATLYALGAKDAGNNLLFYVTSGQRSYSDRTGTIESYVNETEGFTEGHVKKEMYFSEAIRDVSDVRDTLYSAGNALIRATENMLVNNTSGTYEIKCLNEITGITGNVNINWYGSVYHYRTQNTAIVTVDGNNYTMKLQHNMLDYYDYQNYEGIYEVLPGFAYLDYLHMLNEWGMARNYTCYDELTYTISWERGQTINNGATIQGPGL